MATDIKICYMSDLHLEFDMFLPMNTGKADILTLSGDIVPLKYLRSNSGLYSRYIAFFKHVADQYKNVVYIPGNHEYYGGTDVSSDILAEVDNNLPDNVHLINNEVRYIDGLKIFGGILWTDMDKQNPLAIIQASGIMNDYKAIKDSRMAGYRFTAQSSLREHFLTKLALQEALAEGEKMFVMTHHSPSYRSVSPSYKGDSNNAYYHSDLDHLIDHECVLAWQHGHTHTSHKYDKVIANPRGYCMRGVNENENFDPAASITLTI